MRLAWARRCKDVLAAHLADLGGAENVSVGERSLCRRAAVLTTELERFEAQFTNSGFASMDDLTAYCGVTNVLRRVLMSIGLGRRSKDVTPSLRDILDQEGRRQDQEITESGLNIPLAKTQESVSEPTTCAEFWEQGPAPKSGEPMT